MPFLSKVHVADYHGRAPPVGKDSSRRAYPKESIVGDIMEDSTRVLRLLLPVGYGMRNPGCVLATHGARPHAGRSRSQTMGTKSMDCGTITAQSGCETRQRGIRKQGVWHKAWRSSCMALPRPHLFSTVSM
eukprot:scaffold6918_cov158-Amphora_coffeaeformis.AAC.4